MKKLLIVLAAISVCAPARGADVRRFGAIPNDGLDDTAAFLAAAEFVRTNTDKTISLPAGRFDLRADGNPTSKGALMHFSKQKGLRLQGHNSHLIMTGTAGLMQFIECADVSLEGIIMDWKRPPFSQGRVVGTSSNWFDVAVEPDYPVSGGEPVRAFMTYDPVTRLPDGRDCDVYEAVQRTELVSPQVLRLHLKWNAAPPSESYVVLRHQVYGAVGFHFIRCKDVRVQDVTVHAVPGMALVGGVTTNITLKRFSVVLPEGSKRLMTATADATHFAGCKGTISLTDCLFERMGDDGVNVKSGLYLTVREKLNDRTFRCQHNLRMVDLPDTGDVIEMSATNNLLPYATGVVKSAMLENPTENFHRIEFESPAPAALKPGDVLGNASRAPKFRMRNCTVQANRARGVLCQTRDAIIENCAFRNCTGAGVLVLTEVVHFFESIGTRNVTVRNCVFEGCNRGTAAAEGSLCALAWLQGFAKPTEPGVHKDVSFVGNRICGSGSSGIFAAAVDGLLLQKNSVFDSALPPTEPSRRHAILVQDCARVSISGNIAPADKQAVPMREPVFVMRAN